MVSVELRDEALKARRRSVMRTMNVPIEAFGKLPYVVDSIIPMFQGSKSGGARFALTDLALFYS